MTYKPLPQFEDIAWDKVKPLSLILEVGSNVPTQIGEHLMGWPYDKCYTHAMNKIDGNDIMSMSLTVKKLDVSKLAKDHIYTIITYTDLTQQQITDGIAWCYQYIKDHPFQVYDVFGYLGFLTRIIPALRKISWLHGSEKLMFCSDLEVHLYQYLQYPLYMHDDSEKMAPTDLFLQSQTWPQAYFNNLVF